MLRLRKIQAGCAAVEIHETKGEGMTHDREIVMALLLAISVFTDLKYSKIYNLVTIPATVIGIALGGIYGGWQGAGYALGGMAVGAALLIIPYFLDAMGGGDVKLLAAIGALGGTIFVLKTTLYACLVGGVIAVIVMLLGKRIRQGFRGAWHFFRGLIVPGIQPEAPQDLGLPPIRFGVCLAAGAVITRYWDVIFK